MALSALFRSADLVALRLFNRIYFSVSYNWLSADLLALLRRLGGASPSPRRRLGGASPQTWWRFSADLVALLRRLGGAIYVQNTTEHYRTLQNILSKHFSEYRTGFCKNDLIVMSKQLRHKPPPPRPLTTSHNASTTRHFLQVFATQRNLEYNGVGAQRLGMLRPSQREPTQELSFARICNPSSNAQLWRTSTVASGFYPVLSYSTEHHTCRCCRTHDWRRGPVRNQRTGHSWLHTDADAARGGHRQADAGATWGGHRHADVGATWGDQRRPLYLTRQSNQSNQSDSLSVPTLDLDCLGRPEARQ